MRQTLKLHSGSLCPAVDRIEVEAERTGGRSLALRYVVLGRTADLRIPAPAGAGRSDGLWRRTCFEAFIRAPGGEAYWEFNFSPSGQWAAYGFADYRRGGGDIEAVGPLRLDVQVDRDRLALRVTVDMSGVERLPDGPWRMGLSAVIEDAEGVISYWALAHPPGKPDFHHPDCFAAELVAPERS